MTINSEDKTAQTNRVLYRLKQPRWLLLLLAILFSAVYLAVIRPLLISTMATVPIELAVAGILLLAALITLLILLGSLFAALVIAIWTRSGTRLARWPGRLRRDLVILVGLLMALAVVVMLSQWLAYTPPILGADGKPVAGSIATLEKVTLGGSTQWITIRGKDTDNPVLLFLTGGPGGSQLAATRDCLNGLEDHFVVVSWDQPGSAKSYDAVPLASLTPERYISDAHELTLYLRQRFGEEKIYLVGESWGSILGIWLVQRYPELYHAFAGTGQMVAFLETDTIDYELALRLAQESGDTGKVEALQRQGPPPYYGEDVAWKSAAYLMYLFDEMNGNPAIADAGHSTLTDLAGPEYGLYDKFNYLRALIYTLGAVYPQLWEVDLRKQVTQLEVPVYFLEGRHDVNAPPSLVEDYLQKLAAPHKEVIWFEHSGHTPWVSENSRFVDVMVNTVLAETQP
jgi:pimeloyl-ACP methyl ester carboxylesterase